MSIDIRRVDPADVQALADYVAVYHEAERADGPERRVYSLDDTRGTLASTGSAWQFAGFVASADGVAAGAAIHVLHLADNADRLSLQLWVRPSTRGRGVGDALISHAEGRARAWGRTVVEMKAPLHGPGAAPTRAFAERHGYRLVQTMVERRLRLPGDLPAAEVARGYRLQAVRGPVPADLAPGYCDLHNRLHLDAPQGDRGVEVTRRTPEVLAEQDAEIVAQGRQRLTVVALANDGSVVGLTSGVVDGPRTGFDQWATIVAPAHRGKRLGVALKTEQARLVHETWPAVRAITTTNAQDTHPMAAVNDALGYVVTGAEAFFRRSLQP